MVALNDWLWWTLLLVKKKLARGKYRTEKKALFYHEISRDYIDTLEPSCATTSHKVACEQALLYGRSRVLARLASLAQIGELARKLP